MTDPKITLVTQMREQLESRRQEVIDAARHIRSEEMLSAHTKAGMRLLKALDQLDKLEQPSGMDLLRDLVATQDAIELADNADDRENARDMHYCVMARAREALARA